MDSTGLESTGLEFLRDRRTTTRRDDTVGSFGAAVLRRERRTLHRGPDLLIRRRPIQINLARPNHLRRDAISQATQQTKTHRSQENNQKLTLTIVHPTSPSR